jgi:alkanesulfonate monooxygenase SsuD/methylene tetrahydromethanopterin reductase-like flavin-dependent oxidoreductase (luciferase family)
VGFNLWYRHNFKPSILTITSLALVGKTDKIAKKLIEYTDIGVNQFFLAFQDPFDHKALELFAEIFRKWYSTKKSTVESLLLAILFSFP